MVAFMNKEYTNRSSSLENTKRFVVKVGTSSLTDNSSRLDIGKVANLVSMLMREREQGRTPILVSSGAIGAGLGKLGRLERPEVIHELQAAAAVGQAILMQTYEIFFNNYGQTIAQLLLTMEDFTFKERRENLSNTLETLLNWGVIPIINENDTVATEEIKVGDNDTLGSFVALGAKAELMVILTDVDGLYTGNPSDDEGELVDIVEEITEEVEGWASHAGKGFGGMYTKVQAAKRLSQGGIATVIANTNTPNALAKVLKGEIGTLFLPNRGDNDE
ncbi:glutamate 5-kinase [Candidatus Bathyarchaeota archaeon]|nr:glutamate 5-kinase [Candidatus Bathyarchaeota archaeon]